MKPLLRSIRYLCFCGLAAFFAGRILPKSWCSPEGLLYRCRPFEREGRIYQYLGVHRWQKHLPDMSRILPGLMPKKAITGRDEETVRIMIRETCIAELIHGILCVTGFYCIWIWPGIGGLAVAIIHLLVFNLPYILIQRYNRPRLVRFLKRLEKGEAAGYIGQQTTVLS